MRRIEHQHTTDATITRARFYSVACTQWILKLNFFMQTWKDFTITTYMDYGTPTQNRPHNHCFYSVAHFQLDPAVSFNDVKQISGKKLSLVRFSDFNEIGEPDQKLRCQDVVSFGCATLPWSCRSLPTSLTTHTKIVTTRQILKVIQTVCTKEGYVSTVHIQFCIGYIIISPKKDASKCRYWDLFRFKACHHQTGLLTTFTIGGIRYIYLFYVSFEASFSLLFKV